MIAHLRRVLCASASNLSLRQNGLPRHTVAVRNLIAATARPRAAIPAADACAVEVTHKVNGSVAYIRVLPKIAEDDTLEFRG